VGKDPFDPGVARESRGLKNKTWRGKREIGYQGKIRISERKNENKVPV